jgi:hypothetical protein
MGERKRLRIVRVPFGAFSSAAVVAAVPPGAVLVGSEVDAGGRQYRFKYRHPSFAAVPEGELIPTVDAGPGGSDVRPQEEPEGG